MRAWAGFNAALVALDFFVILYGIYLIKRKRDVERHKKVMLTAGAIFVLFLVSFLLKITFQGIQPFPEVTFTPWHIPAKNILYVHEAVAVVTVPLIAIAYWAALTKRFALHKKVVRWAAPLWLFESAFGIVEFYILYFA